MSKQIAVRLPDELVEFIDRAVEHGAASSRAGVVAHAVERERRRMVAARDAVILSGLHNDHDMDELAEYASRIPMDDLD